MKLSKLKQDIEAGAAPHEFMVFVCDENDTFLVNQYIQAICDANNLVKKSVSSLSELNSALSLVFDSTDCLSVLKTSVFDEVADYGSLNDVIVVCNKVDKKVKPLVEDDIVQMPKLAEWQVKDYVRLLAPNMDDVDIDWLYKAAKGDVMRISNELDKLSNFPLPERKLMLEELKYERGSDLYAITAFDIKDALINQNKAVLMEVLAHGDSVSLDFLGLVSLTLAEAKKILLIKYQGQHITWQEAGCASEKQFRYLSRAYGSMSYPLAYLQRLVRFLSNIDLKLKQGLLDMSDKSKIDYLIANVLA